MLLCRHRLEALLENLKEVEDNIRTEPKRAPWLEDQPIIYYMINCIANTRLKVEAFNHILGELAESRQCNNDNYYTIMAQVKNCQSAVMGTAQAIKAFLEDLRTYRRLQPHMQEAAAPVTPNAHVGSVVGLWEAINASHL